MSEHEPKPCPNCHSITNEWGTCSWHCLTCAKIKTCRAENGNECNYKNEEDADVETMAEDRP